MSDGQHQNNDITPMMLTIAGLLLASMVIGYLISF